jgi:hypothetical protein
MVEQDSILGLLTFHGKGRDDAKTHWFMCEAIFSVERFTNEASNIV